MCVRLVVSAVAIVLFSIIVAVVISIPGVLLFLIKAEEKEEEQEVLNPEKEGCNV